MDPNQPKVVRKVIPLTEFVHVDPDVQAAFPQMIRHDISFSETTDFPSFDPLFKKSQNLKSWSALEVTPEMRTIVESYFPSEAYCQWEATSTSASKAETKINFLNVYELTENQPGSAKKQHLQLTRLVVKIIAPNQWYSESQNLAKVMDKFPQCRTDKVLSLPVFTLPFNHEKKHCCEMFVFRKAPGQELSSLLAAEIKGKADGWNLRLKKAMSSVGAALGRFHFNYDNMQHTDFQTSNVFYDKATDQVTFIDLGGLGQTCKEMDIQHFTNALTILNKFYKDGCFLEESVTAFTEAYQAQYNELLTTSAPKITPAPAAIPSPPPQSRESQMHSSPLMASSPASVPPPTEPVRSMSHMIVTTPHEPPYEGAPSYETSPNVAPTTPVRLVSARSMNGVYEYASPRVSPNDAYRQGFDAGFKAAYNEAVKSVYEVAFKAGRSEATKELGFST